MPGYHRRGQSLVHGHDKLNMLSLLGDNNRNVLQAFIEGLSFPWSSTGARKQTEPRGQEQALAKTGCRTQQSKT